VKRPTTTRGRSCGGKERHSTAARAHAHRRRLIRRGAVRLKVYPCRHCGGFHVGHGPTPRT
jgi:hypothetical protein